MHRIVSGRSLRGGKKEPMLVGLVRGEEGERAKARVKCEKGSGERGRMERRKTDRRHGCKKKKVYLKYRRIGSATLKSNTPGGSTILKHLMVATYWDRISLVSAPGWRRRFRFLES